jgi:hypothetical protein
MAAEPLLCDLCRTRAAALACGTKSGKKLNMCSRCVNRAKLKWSSENGDVHPALLVLMNLPSSEVMRLAKE